MIRLGPIAAAVYALLASASYAQEPALNGRAAAPDVPEPSPLEIIVTAQRRVERLQDTPIAVTAVTAESVQKLGLTSIVDVAGITPGASFSTSTGFFQANIRGIGTAFVSSGSTESPIAIYEDGAYLVRTIGVKDLVDNFDIGSIQVLRGPQGTLYGRNATGGVILINSADPVQKLEGRFRAEIGNLEHRQLDGMINVPLGEDLALRVTSSYRHDDGYVHNLISGKDIGGGRAYSIRAKLRWQRERADIILGVQYHDTRYFIDKGVRQDLGLTCVVCRTAAPGTLIPSAGFYDQQFNPRDKPVRTEFYGANLSINYDLGDMKLTSLTTYRHQRVRDSASDNDYTNFDVFVFDVKRAGGSTLTQDFQLTSQFEGRFNFLAGLSYLHDRGYFDPTFEGTAWAAPLPRFGHYPAFENDAKTNSYAGYLEGYYNITDQLKLTLGGRYVYEKRSIQGFTNDAFASLSGRAAFTFRQDHSEKSFTPRFVLAWDNGPTNLYYSFTRGFKAGGFPGPFIFPAIAVKPEKIASHEVGIKQSMLGGRLRANLAAFYFKNKNQQVQSLNVNSGGLITKNSGGVENYGVELDAQLALVEGLRLGLSGAWQHPRYKPFRDAAVVCYDPTRTGAALFGCFADITGTAPPQAPTWSGSFSANYDFPIGSWTASLSGLATYRSAINFTPDAGGTLQYDRDPERVLVNISGFVSPPGEKLRVGFYANNLFDKKYTNPRVTSQPYGLKYEPGAPRTYGLRVEYMF